MKTFRDIKKLTAYMKSLKEKGKTIGFVPTMGYLHEGHLSLMKRAKKDSDISIISIFVNPKQFGPKEDYKKYPRNLKRDERLAKDAGVDIIFYPSAKYMYPLEYKTYVDVKGITKVMCGSTRPGHFRGVVTIVMKLFNIVQPNVAYFGQKDAQQAIVIKKMVEDLNVPTIIKTLPIIRELGGLAMSSRNAYLSHEERKDALMLYKSLREAKKLIKKGEREAVNIKKTMRKIICSKKRTRIEYISIVDAKNLEERKIIKKGSLIALAVRIGKTRLIDNILIN